MKRIARVFPRRTAATPTDEMSFTGPPPMFLPEIDIVHISVAFTYDLPRAEWLREQWAGRGYVVEMGGPAIGLPGGDFIPGMYLKPGYVITSRGCPNSCWFCKVWKREGRLREIPITKGHIVLDDNLLACSYGHIKNVFAMLKQQPDRPVFAGGFEASLLRSWCVDMLRDAKARRVYFAYDDQVDYEPLVEAGRLLRLGGITKESHIASCYVLIGYAGDTFDLAEKRLRATWDAGFMPFAMLYRDDHGKVDDDWKRFQRSWVIPQIVASKLRKVGA